MVACTITPCRAAVRLNSRISNIIDAIRRIGSPSQKSALRRQDEQLDGHEILERGYRIVRHGGETATGFHASIEPSPEDVTALDQGQIDLINDYDSRAAVFFSDFGTDPSLHLLDQLDQAFETWLYAPDRLGYSEDDAVEILGTSFGNHCNATLDMNWVNVSDQFGVSVAVEGREYEFGAYPFDSIRKRVADSEFNFFRSVYVILADQKHRSRKREHAA